MPQRVNTRKLNVVEALRYNEIGLTKSCYRQNLRIIHSLVRSKNTKFEKIWSQTSKTPIVYEDAKIYTNNYTTVHTLMGKNSLPSLLYQLPKTSKLQRIEEALIYSSSINKLCLPRDEFKPFFMAVTKSNWMIRIDNLSGKILQDIYLGSPERLPYRHISWQTQGESILLQTTLFPGPFNSSNRHIVVVLAIFDINPIRFVGQLEIDRNVFGKDVNSANVSEGLLILGTSSSVNGKIRIYNFYEVMCDANRLFTAKLDHKFEDGSPGKVGQFPFGLPVNYKVTKAPPIIFEVQCAEQILHFGGIPWLYVTNPPKTNGVFEVRDVVTKQLVKNGRIDLPNDSTHEDTIAFHQDDSSRLIYESANFIRFYKTSGSDGLIEHQLDLSINETFNKCNEQVIPSTSFPRAAQQNKRYDKIEKTILDDDFENELDFYSILGIDSNKSKNNGKVCIFDNENGMLVKSVDLDMDIDEFGDYSLRMDLETLIITSKLASKHQIHIFRMTRDYQDLEKLCGSNDETNGDENGHHQTQTTPSKRRRKSRRHY